MNWRVFKQLFYDCEGIIDCTAATQGEFGWTSDPIHPDRTWYAVSEDQKSASILSALQY